MDNNVNSEEKNVEKKDLLADHVDHDDYLDDDQFKEEQTENVSNSSSTNNDEFRDKIISMFKIVLIALIIILVVGFIISIFSKKNYSYSSVEDVMRDAAINYFKDNSGKLPKTDDQVVEVGTDILINNGYMKKLSHYIKDEDCSGKVTVERSTTSTYNYTPVLSCGSYTTTSLVDVVRKAKNIVEEGYGVYNLNDEYVYRGLKVNNYVRFNDSRILWRIVKVNSNNEPVLITEGQTTNTYSWDTRYNNNAEDNSGIGVFHNSNISLVLDALYKNKIAELDDYYDSEVNFLTEYDKTKIVSFDACVGARGEEDTTKDGSTECAVTEKVKMAMLPVYDYLNASIDSNCTSTMRPDCQNYNYLNSYYTYWLLTGNSDVNNKAYVVSSYVYDKTADYDAVIRPVIHLNPNVMVESGKGTMNNPYIIR